MELGGNAAESRQNLSGASLVFFAVRFSRAAAMLTPRPPRAFTYETCLWDPCSRSAVQRSVDAMLVATILTLDWCVCLWRDRGAALAAGDADERARRPAMPSAPMAHPADPSTTTTRTLFAHRRIRGISPTVRGRATAAVRGGRVR